MKTTLRWTLGMGLALASGLTGLGHAAAATSSEISPAITIHVRNYAGVAPQTLREARDKWRREIYPESRSRYPDGRM